MEEKNMTLKEFLKMQETDYDVNDVDFDATITCCYIDEINDNYDKFCDMLTSKVSIIRGGDHPIVSWSGFIRNNLDKFRLFAEKNWYDAYEDDEEELVYQWITELDGYAAGMVSESFYKILVNLFEELEPIEE
jgi:hypothetical protein